MEVIIQGEVTNQIKEHIKKIFDLERAALSKHGIKVAIGNIDFKSYKMLELDEKDIKLDDKIIPISRIMRVGYSFNAIRIDYYLNKEEFWSGTVISSGEDAKRIWLYLCALSVDMDVVGQIDFNAPRHESDRTI